ncbi:MAG: NUDIX hydrolase [Desulfatitalea sp.]
MMNDETDKPAGHSQGLTPRNPLLTVDIIIECDGGIVLIERKNPPHGWALPGGFVDYGETIEQAAIREAKEETSLDVALVEQMHTYSDPRRDPRHHTVSTVFIATATGTPTASDDALKAVLFSIEKLPTPLVFDHAAILDDYCKYRRGGARGQVFGYRR